MMRMSAGLAVFAIAAFSSGLALAQTAVSPPSFNGPYLFFDPDGTGVRVIALGTLNRVGDVATLTVIGIGRSSLVIPRVDQEIQIDCSARRMRTIGVGAYGPGELDDEVLFLTNKDIGAWESADDDEVAAYACEGVRPAGAKLGTRLFLSLEDYNDAQQRGS